MAEKAIILSAAGLKNIVIENVGKEEEFTFIFGQKEIKLQKIYAEFISPIVSHLHQCDPTLNSIDYSELITKVSHKKNNLFNEVFNERTISQIVQLSQGYSIVISDKNDTEIRNLLRLSIILGNEEIYSTIFNIFNKKQGVSQRKNDILEEIQIYYELSRLFPEIKYTLLIDEVAGQISSKDAEQLKLLPKSIFYLILKSSYFNFDNIDILIDIINELFLQLEPDDDHDIININNFFESLDFSKLSNKKFTEILTKIDHTKITGEFWHKICEFISNDQHMKEEEEKAIIEKKIEINYDGNEDHLFEGIIHHLSKGKKNNIHDLGIINVTSNRNRTNNSPKSAVDFSSSDYFYSVNSNNYDSWIMYDFKNMRICPSSYSIKAHDSNNCNPVNWKIEVSNTGNENDWITIDTRCGASCVSKANQSYNYSFSPPKQSYRFIRLKQTGPTSNNCRDFAISCLEYFGTLEMA